MQDHEAAVAFMQRYNFALLVTQGAERPQATHLPFHISVHDGAVRLSAHMAKANPQWKDFDGRDVLIVFSGPHAYVSPANYEQEQNVPTWNYIAVHAYGKVNIITDMQEGMQVLEEMIAQSEPGYKAQWEQLSDKYKHGLYRGIVPITIHITELQAVEKLSQNKTAAERQHIIHSLQQYDDGAAHDLAIYMQAKENPPE
jgi:transcriptional regulator